MRRALLALLLLGCTSSEPTARLDEAPTVAEDAETYGEAIDPSIPATSLGDILADPDAYDGEVVRTSGEIARVCQARGCWMELRESEEGPAVRVPMAGHAFFLPMDSAGRHATMQGRVVIQALSPEARAHLEAEGAVATASTLSIQATGVAID